MCRYTLLSYIWLAQAARCNISRVESAGSMPVLAADLVLKARGRCRDQKHEPSGHCVKGMSLCHLITAVQVIAGPAALPLEPLLIVDQARLCTVLKDKLQSSPDKAPLYSKLELAASMNSRLRGYGLTASSSEQASSSQEQVKVKLQLHHRAFADCQPGQTSCSS